MLCLFYLIVLYQSLVVRTARWHIAIVISVSNNIRVLTIALLTVLRLLLLLLPLVHLGFCETLSSFYLEAHVVSIFVAANPNRVSALIAGFVLQNLVSLKQHKIKVIPFFIWLLMKE
jgi:hypothetical protein